MAKLGGLINGQDVAFDTHQAGDSQIVNWKDVHLEKRIHNKRGKARFPILGNQEPSVSGMTDNDLRRVTKEVKKTLRKNESLVKELAITIVDVLKRFSNGEASPKDAREAAKKIAKAFDLNADFLRVVEEYADKKLETFTTIHFNPGEDSLHEIILSKEKITIQKPRRHNSLRRIKPK